jgi:VWFA-related protein
MAWAGRIVGVLFSTVSRQLASLVYGLLILPAVPRVSFAVDQTKWSAQPTIKVSTLVVNIFAVVEDKNGRLVPNLSKEDFVITDENIPQQTHYFAPNAEAPLTLGIVLDTSPSQDGVLPTERSQAKELIHQLLRPDDLAFVLRFDTQVELLRDISGDQRLITAAIDRAVASQDLQELEAQLEKAQSKTRDASHPGTSHLFDAVYLASNELMRTQVGRKVLLLLTDGEDQGSEVKAQIALEAAERANVIIYSIAVIDPWFYLVRGMPFRGESVLRKLSAATGGRLIRVEHQEQVAAAIRQIAEEVRGQYSLGYIPPKAQAGEFRRVKVAVRGRNYRVRTRRGYFSQAE